MEKIIYFIIPDPKIAGNFYHEPSVGVGKIICEGRDKVQVELIKDILYTEKKAKDVIWVYRNRISFANYD